MRFAFAGSVLLCFLAAQLPVNNAGVVPVNHEHHELDYASNNGTAWSLVHDLTRRAAPPGGAGRGGGRGDGSSSGGGSGSNGGGNGSPQTPGGQTGEVGGISGQQTEGGFADHGTEGGFGDTPSNPPPVNVPANPPANAPANNPAFPPSVRNNFNRPSQSDQQTLFPRRPINLADKVAQFRTKMASHWSATDKGPWFFYSGIDTKLIWEESRRILSRRLGTIDPHFKTVDPKTGEPPKLEDKDDDAFMPYIGVGTAGDGDQYAAEGLGTEEKRYYWAMISKAYAQSVSGRVYVVIPDGRPINQPYEDKGSHWWTFEAPELTRNSDVDSITLVTVDTTMNLAEPYFDLDNGRVIWSRGDEPLSTPGDERHDPTIPKESWNG